MMNILEKTKKIFSEQRFLKKVHHALSASDIYSNQIRTCSCFEDSRELKSSEKVPVNNRIFDSKNNMPKNRKKINRRILSHEGDPRKCVFRHKPSEPNFANQNKVTTFPEGSSTTPISGDIIMSSPNFSKLKYFSIHFSRWPDT